MRHVKGNLLDTDIKHICHGCNALGVMGAGVALAIKNKWPNVYTTYKSELTQIYKKFGTSAYILGTDIRVEVDNHVIHNLITQETWDMGGCPARYYAVMHGIRNILKTENIDELAIPQIGCGLGGLNWNIMTELLIEIEKDFPVNIVVYSL